MKEVDNFLFKNYFKELQDLVYSENFGWFFYQKTTTFNDDNNFMFTHMLYNNNKFHSNYFSKFESIKYFISQHTDFNKFLRMKINLYTNQGKKIKHKKHYDWTNKNHEPKKDLKICILNFTNCNGNTFIENKEIKSKENKAVLFDNIEEHYGITQDDKKVRIVLNIIYK